ncbi:protocadherin-9-like isoform X1 [Mytilus galloprovincialis]|uniref:protocadherin-9-like isoform X1 n=1 Tax=Mytilus galloprovincialis TaxID=29158 RepID=UPI003F7C5F18
MAMCRYITVIILSTVFVYIRAADITIFYQILEEQEPPLYLGNVAGSSNLASIATGDEFANMRYSFLKTVGTYFTINENNGALSTNSKLDRETICPFQKSCVLQLRIGASSGTFFQPINVNVTLKDVNDNKPEFSESSIVLNIPEDADINTTYPVIGAVDKDMGDSNSLLTYELLPDSGTFGLKFDDSLSGNIEVSILLKQTVDREVLSRYQVYLVAKDGGTPQRSSMLTINISVTDINDNKPIFSRKQYDITVPEDISVPNKILNITAVDHDAGLNGEVEFTLISSPSSDAQTFFAIGKTTGQLSVIEHLSHTKGAPLSLIVQASDKGTPPKSSQVALTIAVTDVNDNPPEININLLSSGSTARANENSPNGTVVAYIGVTDKDTGNNGIVSCSLRDNTFRLSKLSSSQTEYKVLVNKVLDREKDIEVVVTVDCQDSGNQPLKTTSSFIVQIIDENDNFPEFLKSFYNESMVESDHTGIFIAKVTASDKDEEENAQVRYYVEQGNADKFYADPSTGVIRTTVPFDREMQDVYTFQVLAVDGGQTKAFTSTATVELHILDENDETPHFNQTSYEFKIQENLQSKTFVGIVFATDNDIGDNGKIKYSIKSRNGAVPFHIDPSTGTIQTNGILNREYKNLYTFEVKAEDFGAPSLNSTVNVQVMVLDINDNSPQILYPVQGNGSIKVSHLTPANSVVTKVEAFDPDNGPNGSLSFSIRSRNDNNLFFIESNTGKIFLSHSIQSSEIKDYLLVVEVQDHGVTPRSNSTEIKIRIELTKTSASSEASIGQNVLIVITIVCVTIVLSLAIIVIIFLIRRVDNNKLMKDYPPPGKEEFQISETIHLNTNKKSILTKETNLPNGYNTNTLSSGDRKEVSFSLDDHRDSGIFMIANSESGSPKPQPSLKQIHESSSDPLPHEEEHHRMASIRLHQKLLNSYNKPLLYHPDDRRQIWSKRHGDDTHSDLSEDLTSDSGRGGSVENVHHHQMYPRSGIVI